MPMRVPMMIVVSLVVTIAAALWIVGLVGQRRFRAETRKSVRELLASAGRGISSEQFVARREALPEPLQRYLRYAVGQKISTTCTARLRHGGFFRPNRNGRWFPIEGEEFFTVAKPGFVWNATIRLAPLLWIEARDELIHGRGKMLVRFCSAFTLVNASGSELDQGALLRWLAEVVWFPAGYVGERIHAKPIDSRSAQVTLVHNGLSVTATLQVDEEGKLTTISGRRYRVDKGRSVLTSWKGVCSHYREFGGMRIPTSVEVIWELDEADFSYAKFDVSLVKYGDAACS